MYGKLFAQMFDGTLATKGPWQALVTFQQLVILADKHGCVDMMAEAIARRTTLPLQIIQTGLETLNQPDPESRTPTEDGRRIVLLSPPRPWGWRIVNYEHYRKIRSEEERREYHRQYMRAKRAGVKRNVKVSTAGDRSQPIAVSRGSKQKAETPLGDSVPLLEFEKAWRTLPKRSGNNPKADALTAWKARIREGVTPAAMIEGAQRYYLWCEATGKIRTEHVMRGSTFFGIARPFEQDFDTTDAPQGSTKPWFLSASGIEDKAKEFEIPVPTDSQEWHPFKNAVFQRAGITEAMYAKAKVTWQSRLAI